MNHSFLQFELWKDCNNKCAFCFNDNSSTSCISKCNRIDFVLEELNKKEYTNIERIGLIGGEFFDGQLESTELLNKFILLIKTILNRKNVKQLLITTSLLFLDYSQFKYVLDSIDDTSKVLICTSWDTKYRFNKPWSKLLWEKNLFWLKKHYPNISVHVEIIPTQWHIIDVLNNKFNIRDFEEKFGVYVDYTDLNSGFKYNNKYEFQKDVPGFFPNRKDFIKFLHKVYLEGQASPEKFLNFKNMSTLLWVEVGNEYKLFSGYRGPVDGVSVDSTYELPPMHEDKSDYIDSHIRMRKDVLDVWENIYG